MIMAPFTPFLAEELYRNLTGGESVHLLDWPIAGVIDESVVTDMALVRSVITSGLNQRASSGIKVRQPLAKLMVDDQYKTQLEAYQDVLTDELNVKTVEFVVGPISRELLDEEITPELKREGMMREVVRNVQNARKEAELDVDDRIELALVTDDADLRQAIQEHSEAIQAETLAVGLADATTSTDTTTVKVDGSELKIHITKA